MAKNKEQEIRSLKRQIDRLKDENNELLYRLSGMQEAVDAANNDYLNEQFRVCGSVIIEGASKSAAYQDMVGILLHEGYEVTLVPVQMGKNLKITIKEREGNGNE